MFPGCVTLVDVGRSKTARAVAKDLGAKEILIASRRRRIAAGCGTTVQDAIQLIRQFDEMKKQMKMVMNQSRGKKGRFRFPPMR